MGLALGIFYVYSLCTVRSKNLHKPHRHHFLACFGILCGSPGQAEIGKRRGLEFCRAKTCQIEQFWEVKSRFRHTSFLKLCLFFSSKSDDFGRSNVNTAFRQSTTKNIQKLTFKSFVFLKCFQSFMFFSFFIPFSFSNVSPLCVCFCKKQK